MTHLFVIKRQLLAYIFMCEDHRTNLTCADFSDIQYFFCGTFFVIKKRQYLLCKMQFLKNWFLSLFSESELQPEATITYFNIKIKTRQSVKVVNNYLHGGQPRSVKLEATQLNFFLCAHVAVYVRARVLALANRCVSVCIIIIIIISMVRVSVEGVCWFRDTSHIHPWCAPPSALNHTSAPPSKPPHAHTHISRAYSSISLYM